MKNILFVVKSYSTHNRPNAMCVELITQHIKNVHIDYLSIENAEKYISEPNVIPLIENNDILKHKLTHKIKKFIWAPISDYALVGDIYAKLCEQVQSKNYEMVVAVCNPPEIAEAVYRLKKKFPNLNTILYEIDSNSNRYKASKSIIENYMNYRAYRWEIKIYKFMDRIIHMRSHEKHYEGEKFRSVRDKFMYMDIPCFDPIDGMVESGDKNDGIHLIYAGAFYPKLREPHFMLDFFAEMRKELPIFLDIFTGYKMWEELNKLAAPYDYISLKKEIGQEELSNKIRKMDALISVGNKNSDFLPSKILYYMSTGKKIIHFYPEGDIAVDYLRKYPKAYLISQDEAISTTLIREVKQFIEKDEEVIDMKQLASIFEENTPKYSAEKFKEMLTCF